MISSTGLVRLPIYDNIHYCIINSDSKKEVNKYLKAQGIKLTTAIEPYATTYWENFKDKAGNEGAVVVVIFNTEDKNPLNKVDCGTVAHEGLHVVHFVFNHIDEALLLHSEPQCYLLGWMVNIMAEFLYGKEGPRKKD